jgi:hypothetical protein
MRAEVVLAIVIDAGRRALERADRPVAATLPPDVCR